MVQLLIHVHNYMNPHPPPPPSKDTRTYLTSVDVETVRFKQLPGRHKEENAQNLPLAYFACLVWENVCTQYLWCWGARPRELNLAWFIVVHCVEQSKRTIPRECTHTRHMSIHYTPAAHDDAQTRFWDRKYTPKLTREWVL